MLILKKGNSSDKILPAVSVGSHNNSTYKSFTGIFFYQSPKSKILFGPHLHEIVTISVNVLRHGTGIFRLSFH